MGSVSATTDETWGSIRLDIDLSDVPGVWYIDVQRYDTSGGLATSGPSSVRSGNMVTAGGGHLFVYDHEPPLGVEQMYVARGFNSERFEIGGGGAGVIITTPTIRPEYVWVKCLDNPSLSRPMRYANLGFLGREAPSQEFRPILRKNPVVQVWQTGGRKGPVTFTALTWDDIEGMEAIFEEQSPLLLSFPPDVRVPDMYCRAPKWDPNVIGPRRQHIQEIKMEVTEIDRPATDGVGLKVPGVTWATQAAVYATYTAAAADYTTWSDYASTDLNTYPVTGDVVGVDNGDGTITWMGTDVIDNGDGTYTLNGVTATGSGVFTV